MREGLLAVGELLESPLEAPQLQVVFCRCDRLEHTHRSQSVLELLVHVLGDVHGRRDESPRILEVHGEALEITEELLREFLRDCRHAVPLSFTMKCVHPLTGEADMRNTDDGADAATEIDNGITLLRCAISHRHRFVELVEEVVVAELRRERCAVHVPRCLFNCLASITHENLHGISIFLELLKVEDAINHVLVVSNGVVREIPRVVVGGDERDELVQKTLIVIPPFLSCELCEEIPHVNVRPIHAENTPPLRSQIPRDPCTVLDRFSECMNMTNRRPLRATVPTFDHAIATVIFEMTTDDFPLSLFLSGCERALTVVTPHELHRPFFVHPCSTALGVKTITVRTANDFLS